MTIALKKANFPVKKKKKEKDRSLPGDSEEIQIYTVTFSMDIKLKCIHITEAKRSFVLCRIDLVTLSLLQMFSHGFAILLTQASCF